MMVTVFSAIYMAAFWLFLAYLGYVLIASSLPCLPLLRRKPESTSPFDQAEYYGKNAQGPDRVALLESPVEGLGVRLDLFQHTHRTLDVVCHTIHAGPTTSAFFDGILRAAERGVRVRILLDGKASSIRPSVKRMMRALAAHPNIECRQYNPLHLLKPWKWHFLMHDKYILSDGQYLLLGGRNIGDKFFAPDAYKGKISNDRDVIVFRREEAESAGSAVDQAQRYFDAMWQVRDSVPLRPARRDSDRLCADLRAHADTFVRENPAYLRHTLKGAFAHSMSARRITFLYNPMEARRKAPWIWQQMQRIALGAKRSVTLQTPYITANKGILSSFHAIASRVHLSILTNSVASTPNYPAYSNYYAQRRKFVRTGAHIYEYQNAHSIHGKAMIVDGRLGMIGSFNMDDRSMFLDTEVMLVVDSDAFAGVLSDAISAYQAQSLCTRGENAYEIPAGIGHISVPVYKVPLLRVVSVFSLALRSFI
ncbi:phospholipase D family protein [Eubacteriales bacterium OttesenSCG-928-A19]|nr:phospholipase D family protein [Eubacteriales bacterium OttesenSCG-928-A19]